MPSMIEAFVLGIVQGLTEFLPVSSSGHLVLMKNLFGLTEPDLFFDVMVHFGTLIPILLIFKEDLLKMLRGCFSPVSRRAGNHYPKTRDDKSAIRLIILIGIAIVPAALIGVFCRDLIEQLFASVFAVGISFVLTGVVLALSRTAPPGKKQMESMTFLDAALIGFSQALAIAPGISRSGITISIALLLGIERKGAGRFSFLIFIPAIVGAALLNFRLPESYALSYFSAIAGATLAAALTGYFALKLLLRFVHQGKLYLFSPYCFGIGLFALLFAIVQ